MLMPNGLMRACTDSTHGSFAAASRAASEWHETPSARTSPFSLSVDSRSICRRSSAGHVPDVTQCSSTRSMWPVPISFRNRATQTSASGRSGSGIPPRSHQIFVAIWYRSRGMPFRAGTT